MNRRRMWIWRSNTTLGDNLLHYVFICLSLTSLYSLIESLPETLQLALDEVKECTNFNVFLLTGGPCGMGTGGLQIFPYIFSIVFYLFDTYTPILTEFRPVILEGAKVSKISWVHCSRLFQTNTWSGLMLHTVCAILLTIRGFHKLVL